ncbi:MAG: MerR family transcriptional regulator [Bacteroidales bacterium]|nr:MerR family transcriptional regulator [Bacteroidales bacterium]MBN2818914.1 MerR family transcriptional regulator [Bacteroidales bacterium]
MGSYSIKDLERLSGIKAHTIRIWEKRYGLIHPERTSTNIRTYCDSELKKLLNISILNRNGLKVSKIAQLDNNEILALVNKLTTDTNNADSQLESLYIALIDLDESMFDKVLSRAIIQMGFEKMVTDLLYPFFYRIGIMWQTGTITPAQEHFISNLVRQKLIVAIDSVVSTTDPGIASFTLYLPEKEMHELGLLFMHYLLKKRGFRVLYLGAVLPVESLKAIHKLKPSDYIVTSIVGSMPGEEVNYYLNKVSAEFPDKIILATGQQVESFTSDKENLVVLPSITNFIDYIEKIS